MKLTASDALHCARLGLCGYCQGTGKMVATTRFGLPTSRRVRCTCPCHQRPSDTPKEGISS